MDISTTTPTNQSGKKRLYILLGSILGVCVIIGGVLFLSQSRISRTPSTPSDLRRVAAGDTLLTVELRENQTVITPSSLTTNTAYNLVVKNSSGLKQGMFFPQLNASLVLENGEERTWGTVMFSHAGSYDILPTVYYQGWEKWKASVNVVALSTPTPDEDQPVQISIIPPTSDPPFNPPPNTTYCIGNLIFQDLNQNSIFDTGDAPFPNVKLSLFKEEIVPGTNDYNPVFVASTISTQEGIYSFCNLPEGRYHIDVLGEDAPIGWNPSLVQPFAFRINGHLNDQTIVNGSLAYDNHSVVQWTLCGPKWCGEDIYLNTNTSFYDIGAQPIPSPTLELPATVAPSSSPST